jgi:hypothetical protein
MRIVGGTLLMLALILGQALPGYAAVDFLQDGQFHYGMGVVEANERLAKNEDDFAIQYRIDTPSTNEIVCVYQESEFYRIRFYQGTCYFIERRAEIEAEAVPTAFEQFSAEYGETPEITQSHDQRLWYGRWMLKNRDIELTAYDRSGGQYILTYQEYDPMLLGEALHVQEQEVASSGVQIDPITGKPVLVENDDQASAEEGDENSDEAEAEETGEGDEGDEESEPPPDDDDDDEYEWF